MENKVFSPLLEQFMLTPLVTWVKTFGALGGKDGGKLAEYIDLVDGIYLNEIMLQINPKETVQRTNKKVNNDVTLRIQNLSILVRQIKSYYQETLQQLIMMPLPNVLVLGRNPLSEHTFFATFREEKSEQLLDCRQELEHMETELQRIQQESILLLADARSARAYRDELDALREKAIRVDKLESEVSRYKERLHDIEFYKARVEELKEDNQVLLETKTMLEDQLEGSRSRSDKLHELEKENLQIKAKMHDLEMDRDIDRKRLKDLLEENLALEMAQKQSMDESLHLGWELEQLSKTTEHSEVPQKSLGHEVNELTSSRLLKLEMENQSLLKTVEKLRTTTDPSEGSNSRFLKMEKENQRLSKTLERLENEMSIEKQSLTNVENLSNDLMKEKAELEKTIETLRENSERQVKVLEQENEHLNQTISSLRQRSQISAEARVKDIEKENKILHESIKETSSKLNKMEFERKQLRKELEHYKEKGERAEELEKEVHRLERENEQLQKKITGLTITCDKVEALEQENLHLEVENRKLKKKLDSLNNLSFQLETLEKENTQLDEENVELRRTVDSLKSSCIKVAQLELENKELENEKWQLKKSLDLMKASSKKTERLEVSCQGLDTENQRLQKALENSNKKIQQLESELQDVETENQSLQKNLEELKISSKRLEQLEKENKILEQETSQLEKDKKQLEKENKRLRQQAEIRDVTLDENNLRIINLEKDNKSLNKEMNVFKDSCGRVKDLEKENKELVKQATIDKKTLLTLREELVSEKLKTQQMNNDLEKLTHELEKIGLNKERLLDDEQSTDNSRYKLLESKLESSLKKSLEIKEEKIAALEARLQESSNLNQQLRQELKTVKKNYEALKQREEEERTMQSSPPRAGEETHTVSKWEKESHETTRELLKVKDRLIEVERNNATLQAEKQALRTQLKQLESQSDNLQAQILALQRQTATLQEHNTALQTQNAKLQVENSTLNSKSASLMTQNSQLQFQQSTIENDNESLIKKTQELKSMYDLLVKDHEKLEALHEHQAAEYESLINKHGSLKSVHKNLEVEHKDLEDRYNQLLKQKAQLEDLEKVLKAEQEKMLLEKKNHEITAAEYQKLRDENDKLNQTHCQLLKENEGLQADHKNIKSLLNSATLEQTRLEADFSKLKEQYQQLDITYTKLNNQCELLSQLKGNLEEENRHLLDQIQTLMLQNRTLLDQTMESKDLFIVEQRQYIYCSKPGNPLVITPHSKKVGSKEDDRAMNDLLQTMVQAGGQWTDSSENLDEPDDAATRLRRKELGAMAYSTTAINYATLNPSAGLRSKHRHKSKDNASCEDVAPRVTDESSNGLRIHAARPASFDSCKTTSSNSNNNASPNDAKASALNGSRSRPHSQSSSEFSLSLDNEVWSSSSSPLQQTGQLSQRSSKQSPLLIRKTLDIPCQQKKKTASPGREVVTLQQFLEESSVHSPTKSGSQENLVDETVRRDCDSSEPVGREKPHRNSSRSRGILRSLSSRTTGDFSDGRPPKPGQIGKPNLRKAESTRIKSTAARPTLSAQGKAKSLAEKLDTVQQQPTQRDCSTFSTLPRASSVISTAEGSTRRTSIHDFMSKDTRQPVSVDPSPIKANRSNQQATSEYHLDHHPHFPNHVPYQNPSHPILHKYSQCSSLGHGHSPVMEGTYTGNRGQIASSSKSFFGSTFTVDSVFTDSVEPHSDSVASLITTSASQPFLSLNTSLVSNISGLPPRATPRPTDIAFVSPVKAVENKYSVQDSSPENTLPTGEPVNINNESESLSLSSEDNQSLWYEYGCV
ncbi:UNVERIFIED_CONTAM: hypothetical protein FKN15_054625 [Acipenser sinensis]